MGFQGPTKLPALSLTPEALARVMARRGDWREASPSLEPHTPPPSMFIGEYRHTFDAKNRISLPARFRKELGASVIVTRGLDKCLFIYPKASWKKEAAKIAEHSTGGAAGRGLARLMLAGASEADLDSAGRILVPDYLKSFAKLREKAVVAGVSDRIEVWDEKAWGVYTASIERDADSFAETLST